MERKDYIIIALLGVIALGIILMPRIQPEPSDTRRILDSIAYERKMDSLTDLKDALYEELLDLEERYDSLTLALDSYEKRRRRPPSRIADADSLRDAILRAAGILHDGRGQRDTRQPSGPR